MVTGVSDRRNLAAAPAGVHRLRGSAAEGAVGAGCVHKRVSSGAGCKAGRNREVGTHVGVGTDSAGHPVAPGVEVVAGISDRCNLAPAPASVHRLRCSAADGAVDASSIIQGERFNQLIANGKQVLGLCRRNFVQPVGNPCPALGFDDPFVSCGREGVGRPVPGVRDVGEPLTVQPGGSICLLVVDQAPHFLSVGQAPVPPRGAVAEAAAAAGQAACCGERLSLRAFVAEAVPLFQPDQVGEQVGNGAIAIVDKAWVGPRHA